MKRVVVLSFLTLATCLLAPSQAAAQGFGIKVGLQQAQLRGNPDAPGIEYGRRTAWSGGIFVNADLMAVKVRPELHYSRRGATIKNVGESTISSTFQLDYVEIPVLILLGRSPNLFFGPYGALRTGAKLVTPGEDASTAIDVSDSVESLDYGLIFGVGMSFGGVGLEARYTLGLKRTFRPIGGETKAPDLKHQALGLFANISF